MAEACHSLCQPGFIVTLAGFQNIEESPPEPDAAPAKDTPCAVALCSRTAKAPARAPELAAASADRETAAKVSARYEIFMEMMPRARRHGRDRPTFYAETACQSCRVAAM